MIKNIKVALPPIPEQQKVIGLLDNLQEDLERIKKLREDALREFDALLPTILDKALQGKL